MKRIELNFSTTNANEAIYEARWFSDPSVVVYPSFYYDYGNPNPISRSSFLLLFKEYCSIDSPQIPSWLELSGVAEKELSSYIDPADIEAPHILYDVQVEIDPASTDHGFTVSFLLRPCSLEEAPPPVASCAQGNISELLGKKLLSFERALSSHQIIADAESARIPFYFNGNVDRDRQQLLFAEIFFLLLGDVEIEYVDDLQMLSLDYVRELRPRIEAARETARVMERERNPDFDGEPRMPSRIDPEEVDISFPLNRRITEGRLIELFGCYEYIGENGIPVVSVCRDNIDRFVTIVEKTAGFSRFTMPFAGESAGKLRECIQHELEQITLAHELGHHVFRSLSDKLSVQDSETLANWFASILLTGYHRELIRYLTAQQSPEYRHLLRLPGDTFTEKQYQEYCDALLALMGEIAL